MDLLLQYDTLPASSSHKYCPEFGDKDKIHLTGWLKEKSGVIQACCLRSQLCCLCCLHENAQEHLMQHRLSSKLAANVKLKVSFCAPIS